MKTPRNPDQLIRTYLQEDQVPGQPEVSEHVYNAIRDGIEQTRQRAVIGSMGVPDMNKFLAIGLGTAAVVAVLLVGSNLFGSSIPPPGGAPSPSVAPSEAPSEPEPSTGAGLPVGPHLLWETDGVAITVNIAAPLWDVDTARYDGILFYMDEFNGGLLCWGDPADRCAGPPDGAGIQAFADREYYVYGDPCAYSSTRPDTPATTVDVFVAALASQASREASAPEDITVDGYAGKKIILQMADDIANFQACDAGHIGLFGVSGGDLARSSQGPGQIEEVWALDVDGQFVVNIGLYYPETAPEVVDQVRALLQSATFELP